MQLDHSFLPPSGAHAWSKCALWPTMNARFPQDNSPDAMEGSAAHWVVSKLLEQMLAEIARVDEYEPIKAGMPAPNGQIVTEEMLQGGDLACEAVYDRIVKRVNQLTIERQVKIPTIGQNCFGTPDYWGADTGRAVIAIVDYKFGHRFVDEYFNLQGLLYLLGIIASLHPQVNWDMIPNYSVSFTIVQPRCYYKGDPIRTHSFYLRDAFEYVHALKHAAALAQSDNPQATTNEACRDCPGRHACSALQESAYDAAEFSSQTQPLQLTPAAAGLELKILERALARIEARVEGLKEMTIANLRAGKSVPYYRLESGKGRRQWSSPNDEIIAMGKLFGHDLSTPGIMTPLQARKKGIDEAVINSYSVLPTGNIKLVEDNPADARRVFGRTEER